MSEIVKTDVAKLRAQLERKLPPKLPIFQLTDIPEVMRSRLGWPIAAQLMDRWFRHTKFEMPVAMKLGKSPYQLAKLTEEQLDESTVKMSWALGFARVQAAMLKLKTQWASSAGLELLQERVMRQGIGKGASCWQFGNLSLSAKALDKLCQVNVAKVGHMGDPMDDFYGAIGEATLKVAVSGMVTSNGQGRASIEVSELGFYLRDAYDFNDDSFLSQPLGFWGFNGVERSLRIALDVPTSGQFVHEADVEGVRARKYLVQNKHFRQWRARSGKGGDFMVLSDVHRVRLPMPMRFEW